MDREEFKKVWLPYGADFYRAAFSILKSGQEAEDAVQDLYIRLWNNREKLTDIASPKAYGLIVIRHICIDRTRAASARGTADDIDTVTDSAAVTFENAEKRLITKEMLKNLKKALEELPENSRKVAELRFFEQLEYGEIVKRTGLSYINVRVLVNRARKKLSEALGKQ